MVYLPDDLTTIGEKAFNGCSALEDIEFPAKLETIGHCAFEDCISLETVTFDGGVTTIGSHAFNGCEWLRNLVLPAGLETIDEGAFWKCTRLSKLTFPASLTTIGDQAFFGCSWLTSLTIPATLTSIGYMAFGACSELVRITVEAGNPIYDSRDDCNAIIRTSDNTLLQGSASTVIPSTVTAIYDGAFNGCRDITDVTIPADVTSIGTGAFFGCARITAVTIPAGVTFIGFSAFSNCSKLASIVVEDGNPTYESLGSNALIEKSSHTLIAGCSNTTIPASVTAIGVGAFSGNNGLTAIVVPGTVKTIGASAFERCANLASVTLSEGVTKVEVHSFSDCTKLASVSLPSTISCLEMFAFSGCSALKNITCNATTAPDFDKAFEGLPSNGILCVPYASISDYSGWLSALDGWRTTSCDVVTYQSIYDITVEPNPDPFNVAVKGNSYELIEGYLVLDGILTTVNAQAFKDCMPLSSITLPGSVTAIGNQAFMGCTSLSQFVIPDAVTSVGTEAFSGCDYLVDVQLPRTLAALPDRMFYGCTRLHSLASNGYTFSSIGKETFYGCGFTQIALPIELTTIGDRAFAGCIQLNTITCFANTAPALGADVFKNLPTGGTLCVPRGADYSSWLSSLPAGWTIDDNTCSIIEYTSTDGQIVTPKKADAFGDGVSILTNIYHDGKGMILFNAPVTIIGASAFEDRHTLATITLPDGVTTIDAKAFRCCEHLTAITLPEGLTYIGSQAFDSCVGLTAITLPEGLTFIGVEAFYVCGFTTLTLPEGLTSLGFSAFSKCMSLTSVTLPASLQTINGYVFNYCKSLTSIYIPRGVKTISNVAFSNCTALKSIEVDAKNKTFDSRDGCNAIITTATDELLLGCRSTVVPESVLAIGNNAFADCEGITDVFIPEGVTAIGEAAFAGCADLETVFLPSTMTTIGTMAFAECPKLVTFNCDAATPPTATDDMLDSYTGVTLCVPSGKENVYMNEDPWRYFNPIKVIAPVRYKTAANTAWVTIDDQETPAADRVLNISDTWYTFNVLHEIDYATVTYSRTFGTDKWQSLCLPFEAKVADFEGKFDVAYVNNFVQYADSKGNIERSSIEIVPVTEGSLRAGMPYFIRAKVADSKNAQVMTFHNVTLRPTTGGKTSHVESAVPMADFYGAFIPIDKSVVVDDHLFLVSGGDFKWLNQNVKCFRTYMKLTSKDPMFIIDPNAAIPIRVIGEDYDEDATGINGNGNGNVNGNGNGNGDGNDGNGDCVVYDLQGRRVDNPQRGGLYIVGGRKMLIH